MHTHTRMQTLLADEAVFSFNSRTLKYLVACSVVPTWLCLHQYFIQLPMLLLPFVLINSWKSKFQALLLLLVRDRSATFYTSFSQRAAGFCPEEEELGKQSLLTFVKTCRSVVMLKLKINLSCRSSSFVRLMSNENMNLYTHLAVSLSKTKENNTGLFRVVRTVSFRFADSRMKWKALLRTIEPRATRSLT